MRRTSCFLFLAIAALAAQSNSQSLSRASTLDGTDTTLDVARKDTVMALRKVATPDEFSYLARLGDFEGARQLALRTTDSHNKKWMLEVLPLYRAEAALVRGDLVGVERELKGLKGQLLFRSAKIWLRLSTKYSELKRPADARRTAFYAVNQLRSERDISKWSVAAERLCELGEREATRRLIAAAEHESPASDSTRGAGKNYVVEMAAQCGFDDIVLRSESRRSDLQIIAIYGRQNRDEMARRFIAHLQKKDEAILQKRAAVEGAKATFLVEGLGQFRAMRLLELARAQSKRGDLAVTSVTLHEANQSIDANPDSPGWFEVKALLLMESEANALWPLADEIGATIERRLNASDNLATKSPLSMANNTLSKGEKFELDLARSHYAHVGLGSYRLLLLPDKYSLKQRTEAYHRFMPRALQILSENPVKKAKVHYILGRWQRNLNLPIWRTTLQIAQDEIFKSGRTMEDWLLLEPIASEWKLGGETSKARNLGQQLLKRWQQAPSSNGKFLTSTTVARVLTTAGQPAEATRILFPPREPNNLEWSSSITQLAKAYPSPPPKALLLLPIAKRREALQSWVEGIAPQSSFIRPHDDDEIYSSLRPIL
jgi:hypothetical protein